MSSASQQGVESYLAVTSLVEKLSKGTGDNKEKKENADEAKDATKVDDLPKTPESDWKKPICKVYSTFDQWLDKGKNQTQHIIDSAPEELNFSWYMGGESNVSVWDRDRFHQDLFDTTEIQEQYRIYLNAEDGVNGDPSGIKFQSGQIMADERAFYLRHASIAQSMTCGLMTKEKQQFIHDVYTNHINKIRELCDKHWEACHEERFKKNS